MIHGLDISFSADKVTHEWAAKRIAEGYTLLYVDLWTGIMEIPGTRQALTTWREAGGRTGAYYVIHEYRNKPVSDHFWRARDVAGDEWEHLVFCAPDVEVDPCSVEGVRKGHDLVVENGIKLAPIYTSWYMWSQITGGSSACADLPWLPAQYDHIADLGNVIRYGGWQTPIGKQYTNTTELDGLLVDFNVFQDWILEDAMNQAQINEVNAIADMFDNPADPEASYDALFGRMGSAVGPLSQYGYRDTLSERLRDEFRGLAERLRKIPTL